ncbi:MAG: GNAT family N-acetyltransferase [Coprobacillaceae bacterium]
MQLQLITYVNNELPVGWKPYYIYEIIVDNQRVGKIVFSEGTLEERYYDGHIGYTIEPEYRGHNYAFQATKILLDIIKEKNYKEIIITCSPDNIASKRSIQKLNAIYLETKKVPKEIQKYFQPDEKIKEIYYISL